MHLSTVFLTIVSYLVSKLIIKVNILTKR